MTFPDEPAQAAATARIAMIFGAVRTGRLSPNEIAAVGSWAQKQVAAAALLERVLAGEIVIEQMIGVSPVFRPPTAAERERIEITLVEQSN